MNTIFTRACQVLIWVGESDGYTASLFRFFESCKERHDELPATVQADSEFRTEADRASLKRVPEFANRTWFQRAWTFQEACLSDKSEIICGRHRLPWRTFVTAALYMKTQGMTSAFGAAADTIMALAHFSAASLQRQTPILSVLLPLTRGLKASDPRDKVFSLLGMVDHAGFDDFRPDYSMDVAEVYTLCARAMINQELGLSVLSGTHARKQTSDLPSWVPDWRIQRRTAYIHGFEWPSSRPFLHQINKGAPFSNDVASSGSLGSGRHLSLRAARIDIVEVVHRPKALLIHLAKYHPSSKNHHEWRKVFDQKLDELRQAMCPEDVPQRIHREQELERVRQQNGQALLRTLCANRVLASADARSSVGALSRWIPPRMFFAGSQSELDDTVAMIWTFMQNRLIFRTKEGLIGIGPDFMAKNDEVWDLVGGKVPFVLRPLKGVRSEIPPHFLFVGECYVHGIMNGELWAPATDGSGGVEAAVKGDNLEFKPINLI